MDELRDEDASDGLRHSRGWAIAALLLLLTSVWLPWWLVRFQDAFGGTVDEAATSLWRPGQFSHAWGPWVSGFLIAVAALVLFVRVAGKSWLHEPREWRRDIGVAALATGAALVLAGTWPKTAEAVIGGFWSNVDFTVNGTKDSFVVATLPGLGWWSAVLAAVCLSAAWWVCRDTTGK